MKRIYLLVLVFGCLSIMPSFAMKIITNDQSSRIVPSRSTTLQEINYVEESYQESQQYFEVPVNNFEEQPQFHEEPQQGFEEPQHHPEMVEQLPPPEEMHNMPPEEMANQPQPEPMAEPNQEIPGYQGERFEVEHRPLLAEDMRDELIGTDWDYPEYYHPEPQPEPMPEPPMEPQPEPQMEPEPMHMVPEEQPQPEPMPESQPEPMPEPPMEQQPPMEPMPEPQPMPPQEQYNQPVNHGHYFQGRQNHNEAADYYIIDTIANPGNPIPVGY